MSASRGPWAGRRMHFLGVGGAGMSAYARAAFALGASVSGSDSAQTPYLARLRSDGVLDAKVGYAAANVPAEEEVEVFYSSAVPPENPERVAARERGLPERPRADVLGELSALRRTIAVAGTHGKTTTSAMIVHALRGAGADPGWMIGGTIGAGLANAHWSEAEWLVVEADESDRSMLSLKVEIAVLTNAELDHHAAYASLAQLMGAYAQFLAGAPQAVIWARPQLLALREGPYVPYDASSPRLHPGGSCFTWRGHDVRLEVPGAHNALNATGALEAARLAGVEEVGAIEGIAHFAGAGRRFQRLGHTPSGALVVDDYAHHPTEVRATIAAARTELADGGGRLAAVFQPHLFSRTALLADEFGEALASADLVAVLEVYAARERRQDHPGVSGLAIARAASEHAGGRQVMWLPRLDRAEQVLRGLLRRGDICLVMGAGDVDALARGLVQP
jgi:UDP-N-acetylmuramate--alanine ligase